MSSINLKSIARQIRGLVESWFESFKLKVGEWHYAEGEQLKEIVAYHNIEGEISVDRKLNEPHD